MMTPIFMPGNFLSTDFFGFILRSQELGSMPAPPSLKMRYDSRGNWEERGKNAKEDDLCQSFHFVEGVGVGVDEL